MSRTLYRFLLRMHPSPFRHRYEDEFLWIFDEHVSRDGSAFELLRDAFASVLRQWLHHENAWTMVAALAGGLLYMGFAMSVIPHT